MKIVVIKKSIIVLVGILVVFTAVYLSNLGAVNVSEAYFVDLRRVPIYKVDTDENKLSISFDAAWGADKTREIMNVCDQYGVKATFFLVGFWVEKYPEIVKEIYNRGFEIGLHSSDHLDMTKLSKSEIKADLNKNIEAIEKITGTRPKLFRPPYGYYNNSLLEVCDELGLICIEWSVDSLDWKGLSASELSGRVIKSANSGSIVLFHNNSDNIIPGLTMTLEYFESRSIETVPIGELIYLDNYRVDNQGIQRRT